MDCPRCGFPLEKNQDSCSICKWGAREPIRDLGAHLDSLEKRKKAAELQARVDNLTGILATVDPQETEAQATLGISIELHKVELQVRYAEAELAEGNASPERTAQLNRTIEEWNKNLDKFKETYAPIMHWLNEWDAKRIARRKAEASIQPAESEPAQQSAERAEKHAGRTTSPIRVARWALIREVSKKQPQLDPKEFWTTVHNYGGRPELTWIKGGCPKRLDDAFDHPDWKSTVTEDKSRALSNS